jgi:hypothetical protein
MYILRKSRDDLLVNPKEYSLLIPLYAGKSFKNRSSLNGNKGQSAGNLTKRNIKH